MAKYVTFDRLKPDYGFPWTHDHTRRLYKKGKFPVPVQISENRKAWIDTELEAEVERRRAERDAEIERRRAR